MYFLDRARGRRRRGFLADQLTHWGNHFGRELGRAARDLNNRAFGLAAMAKTLPQAKHCEDEVLSARVRSRIGRATTHPGAIEIKAKDGCIRIRGPILADELGDVLYKIRSTPGVRRVENGLEIHSQADVPELQAPGRTRNGNDRAGWKPANRLIGGLAAGGLVVYGMRRGGLLGAAAKMAGLGVMARAASNHTLGSLVGLDGRCEVAIQKTVLVQAPVDTVFRFLSNYSNFPRFMSHLEEVRNLGNGRSHWMAAGPGGVPVAWNARTTKRVENIALAWESEPESQIEHNGKMHFEARGPDRTRISLHMCYKPPAGFLGHTVASMLGVDPKHQIDEDFVRLKSLIEQGKTTAHGKHVTRQEIESLMTSAAAAGH
jgi:uncharacterized membrane protein